MENHNHLMEQSTNGAMRDAIYWTGQRLVRDGLLDNPDDVNHLTLDELQVIIDRVAQHFPGGSVIIRGDRKADLGRAIAILNTCRNADIQNISFAALQEEIEEGP